jgi:S1-C subfamily serine protease
LALPRRIVRHFGLTHESGVRIESIEAGSPAASADLKSGDVIISLDGRPVANIDDLQRLLVGEAIGRTTEIAVVRRDRVLKLTLTPRESEPHKR